MEQITEPITPTEAKRLKKYLGELRADVANMVATIRELGGNRQRHPILIAEDIEGLKIQIFYHHQRFQGVIRRLQRPVVKYAHVSPSAGKRLAARFAS